MTRDYSRRAAPSEAPEKISTPGWVVFLYGLLSGVLLTGVSWMILTPADTPLKLPGWLTGGSGIPLNAASKQQQPKDQPQRPRFDFYTILPEMEVVISDEEIAEPAAPKVINRPVAPASVATDSAVRYRLQVGSFKKASDADRQKAKLAMLGVEADIQRVNIGQGETYYRVLTASVADKSELNAQKRLFQQNKINSLVVQIRN